MGTPVTPQSTEHLHLARDSEEARKIANKFLAQYAGQKPYVLMLAGHMIAASATLCGSKREREQHVEAAGEIYDQMQEALRVQMEADGVKR